MYRFSQFSLHDLQLLLLVLEELIQLVQLKENGGELSARSVNQHQAEQTERQLESTRTSSWPPRVDSPLVIASRGQRSAAAASGSLAEVARSGYSPKSG